MSISPKHNLVCVENNITAQMDELETSLFADLILDDFKTFSQTG